MKNPLFVFLVFLQGIHFSWIEGLSIIPFSYEDKPLTLWHEVESFASSDDSLTLEDGSVWNIHPKDRNILKKWKNHDLVFIQQNTEWYSSFCYEIVNLQIQESLRANLYLPPSFSSQNSYTITDINKKFGYVTLQDDSVWNTCFFYTAQLENWKVGDIVLVGINASNLIRGDYILINATLQEYLYTNLQQKGEVYD